MLQFSQYSFYSQTLAFFTLAFCLVALIFSLASLWRSHKMLATFVRLCIVSVSIFALRKVVGMLGLNDSSSWVVVVQYFDLPQSFFFMLAAIEFYKIIRRLDGEAPKKK